MQVTSAKDNIFVEANGQAYREHEEYGEPLSDGARARMEDWDDAGDTLKSKGWEHRPGPSGLAQGYFKTDARGWKHELGQGMNRDMPDEISWVHAVHLPETEGPSMTKYRHYPELGDAGDAAERMINGGADFTGYKTKGARP